MVISDVAPVGSTKNLKDTTSVFNNCLYPPEGKPGQTNFIGSNGATVARQTGIFATAISLIVNAKNNSVTLTLNIKHLTPKANGGDRNTQEATSVTNEIAVQPTQRPVKIPISDTSKHS